MDIVSKNVEIVVNSIDDISIENKLSEMGYNPIRWAIVKINGNKLTICLAC